MDHRGAWVLKIGSACSPLRGGATGDRFRWRVSTTGRIANGRQQLYAGAKVQSLVALIAESDVYQAA